MASRPKDRACGITQASHSRARSLFLDVSTRFGTMADDLLQMFQSITTTDHDELVDQFAYLLELDTNTAAFFLESSNWNVEVAVNNYLATVEPPFYQSAEREDLDMEDDEEQRPPEPQYQAQFISDLTQAQNTVLPPNSTVDMQWTFVNNGNVPWPADTHLEFQQGERFEGPTHIAVASAAPGATIDVHVTLRMPSQMGSFAGSWQLRSTEGSFGDHVWVVLNVGASKQDVYPSVQTLPSSAAVGGPAIPDDDMMDL
ncbi:hypothetical protein Poli38472_014732 [Pythium oligandrum]|uniref:Nbr1 FW domain-containing protein n=1 Tax=Pythium oligandrum TaxID=41045 RepID=A0A8K1FAD8_PYTOL|nr:hypothetical protein Poli38472_014732 [Pythium oligandrum]|eukprot:TMW54961.1 hypothetical protein Poli38472_014732 [Pythium oligandrum]